MNPYDTSRNVSVVSRARQVPKPRRTGPQAAAKAQPPRQNEIKIGKATEPLTLNGRTVAAEVFTLTLGTETIPLVPLKNWSQLDTFKWRTRGLLPGTPAGLEISPDHVKVGDQTVSTWDLDGCAKLERAFNEWLALERKNLELAKAKTAPPSPASVTPVPEEDALRFQVEMDNARKPRIRCVEGKDTVKIVALNAQGLNALITQGLMRKPRTMKIGALHDWIELDGQVFRFGQEGQGTAQLEKTLNERYHPSVESNSPPDVLVFSNPASPTGFDLQFPAAPNGLAENRRRHLDEQTIELLSDPQRCRVLRKGILAKFAAPNLVFKRATLDGGEAYLEPGPETLVSTRGQEGEAKTIDLSQPVNLLNLGVPELTAVLNHPSINRRAKTLERGQG